jgi:hypothetical protein
MGLFKNMKTVSPTAGGNYVQPGDYVFQIQRVLVKKSEDPAKKGAEMYIVELLTIESKQTDEERKPNAVGSRPSWIVKLTGTYEDLAMGNVKNFLLAAFGSLAEAGGEDHPDDEDVDEEMSDYSVSEENPLAGVFVVAHAFNKPTRAKTDFTRVNWDVPDNLDELVEAA